MFAPVWWSKKQPPVRLERRPLGGVDDNLPRSILVWHVDDPASVSQCLAAILAQQSAAFILLPSPPPEESVPSISAGDDRAREGDRRKECCGILRYSITAAPLTDAVI